MIAAGPAVWAVLSWTGPVFAAGGRDGIGVTGWIVLVLVSPVVEEIVFRGMIQSFLERRSSLSLGPLTLANVLTSILFSAAHALRHPPVWAALVFFPSLLFGFARERYGRLGPSIMLHVFYNAGFFWFLL